MQTELTLLQIELVKHLLAQPGATIRWYSHRHANKDVAGRGELRGVTSKFGRYWKGGLVAGYTVRQLVNRGLLRPSTRPTPSPSPRAAPCTATTTTTCGTSTASITPEHRNEHATP